MNNLVADPIAEIALKVRAGNQYSLSVRDFLKLFGAQRRGVHVVRHIRDKLAAEKLTTKPDFETAYIDGNMEILNALEPTPKEPTDDSEARESPLPDPTFRVRQLEAANRTPTYISPNNTIREAVTIMLMNDYSQLPVLTDERMVKGAVTWRSIGRSLVISGMDTNTHVHHLMKWEEPIVVSADESLFDAIERIVTNQYVLVRNPEQKICGIVTTSDLSLQFRELSEPFLRLSEIENQIRRIIVQGGFDNEQLKKYCDPNDVREISSVADLTLGEYLRLMQDPESWVHLKLGVDRKLFIKGLEKVRRIRNDVMHFDPDPIGSEDLVVLRNFRALLHMCGNWLSNRGATD